MIGGEAARKAEPVLVVLVALHSLAVAVCLLFFTRWTVAFGGWGEATPLFFPRQGGAFHLVLAAVYLIEWFRYRGVTCLVVAKLTAAAFLAVLALGSGAWAVPAAGAADGLMGLLVLYLHARAN